MTIDPVTLTAFEDELEKQARLGPLLTAGGNYLRRSSGTLGAGLGVGALAGGVAGVASGAAQGARDTEGLSGGERALGVAGGAASGLVSGAKTGLLLGGLGGLALGGRGAPIAQRLAQTSGPVGAFARSGQRQVHTLTGLVPNGASRGTKEYVDAVRGMRMSGMGAELSDDAIQKGLTNVPGFARALTSRQGVNDVWAHALKPQLQTGKGKVLAALPVALAAPELMTGQDVTGQGRGRMERFGHSLGSGLGYSAAPFLALSGGEVVSRAAGAAGGVLGRGVDKVAASAISKAIDEIVGLPSARRKNPPMHELGNNPSAPGVNESSTSQGVERIFSNAALGRPPENLMT